MRQTDNTEDQLAFRMFAYLVARTAMRQHLFRRLIEAGVFRPGPKTSRSERERHAIVEQEIRAYERAVLVNDSAFAKAIR